MSRQRWGDPAIAARRRFFAPMVIFPSELHALYRCILRLCLNKSTASLTNVLPLPSAARPSDLLVQQAKYFGIDLLCQAIMSNHFAWF